MRKYSYPQELYAVGGKKIKRIPHESRCQYWDRIKRLQEIDKLYNKMILTGKNTFDDGMKEINFIHFTVL